MVKACFLEKTLDPEVSPNPVYMGVYTKPKLAQIFFYIKKLYDNPANIAPHIGPAIGIQLYDQSASFSFLGNN